MWELLKSPWPWYVSGPLIAAVMFSLVWFGKNFGISSTLRTICSIGGAGRKVEFFNFNWKDQVWNLVFVFGAILGGYIATNFLSTPNSVVISDHTIQDLANLGIEFSGELLPAELFNWNELLTSRGLVFMVLGGFLVGFGTRYAGGCTSGHAITGLSNLQPASLIAVIGFFAGGLLMTFLIFPLLLG